MQNNPFVSPRFDEGFPLRLSAPSETQLWMNAQRLQRGPLLGELSGTLSYLSMRLQTYTGDRNVFDTRMFAYHYAAFHVLYTEVIVAGKLSTKSNQQQTEWKGFLDYRLTEDELADADNWTPTEADVWDRVERHIIAGLRIQISYSTKLGLATATFTDYRPNSKTAGYALSGQDTNGALALKLLLYKHDEIFKGDWTPLLGRSTTGRRG